MKKSPEDKANFVYGYSTGGVGRKTFLWFVRIQMRFTAGGQSTGICSVFTHPSDRQRGTAQNISAQLSSLSASIDWGLLGIFCVEIQWAPFTHVPLMAGWDYWAKPATCGLFFPPLWARSTQQASFHAWLPVVTAVSFNADRWSCLSFFATARAARHLLLLMTDETRCKTFFVSPETFFFPS